MRNIYLTWDAAGAAPPESWSFPAIKEASHIELCKKKKK
jgi:hypothetical protein